MVILNFHLKMGKLQNIIFLIIISQAKTMDSDIINGTELISTFMVHRHGDRTPLSNDLSFTSNPEGMAKIIAKYGLAQLTPRGKYRGYQIGQFVRKRYSSLLSAQYNSSELYLHSSDHDRTKMTALTAMAAVYPPGEDNWSEDINWNPVPYTTCNTEYDYLTAVESCHKLAVYMTTCSPQLPQHKDILDKWSRIIGFNLTKHTNMLGILGGEYHCQRSLGIPLIEPLEAIWPDIEKVVAVAVVAIIDNEEYIPSQAGVLINDFFKYTCLLINGEDTPRVRQYSAHDISVLALMAASKVKDLVKLGVPKYGATFALELRRMVETGQYVVLPVYLPDPAEDKILYLKIDGCDNILCEYDQFKRTTSKYLMKEETWRKDCGSKDKAKTV